MHGLRSDGPHKTFFVAAQWRATSRCMQHSLQARCGGRQSEKVTCILPRFGCVLTVDTPAVSPRSWVLSSLLSCYARDPPKPCADIIVFAVWDIAFKGDPPPICSSRTISTHLIGFNKLKIMVVSSSMFFKHATSARTSLTYV